MSGPRVVVGIDGSGAAATALDWALAEAERLGGRVDAVTVWSTGVDADRAADLADQLDAAALRHPTVPFEHVSRVGRIAVTVLAEACEAALLVLGDRGVGHASATTAGSVTTACLDHACCPVAVVSGDGVDLDAGEHPRVRRSPVPRVVHPRAPALTSR